MASKFPGSIGTEPAGYEHQPQEPPPPEGLALPKVGQHHAEGGPLAGRRPKVGVAHACGGKRGAGDSGWATGQQLCRPVNDDPVLLQATWSQPHTHHATLASPGSGSSRQLSHLRSKCTMPRSSRAPTAAATCKVQGTVNRLPLLVGRQSLVT